MSGLGDIWISGTVERVMKARTYEQIGDQGSDAVSGARWLLEGGYVSEATRLLNAVQSAMDARRMELTDVHQAFVDVHLERRSGPGMGIPPAR